VTNRVTALEYNIDITETITKGNKMAYVAYEIRQTKETATGTRHLVRCNRLGKWAICSWVGSTGSAMGNPECQGNYDYVMKKWKKIQKKRNRVT
jgi:hypothetical protein